MKDKTQKKPNLINVVRWYLPMWMLLSVVVIIGQVFHPVIWILLSVGTFGGFLVWIDRKGTDTTVACNLIHYLAVLI